MSVRAVLDALQAIAATAVECELTREFGVEWIPRADGRGNEIQGITQAQMNAYSWPDVPEPSFRVGSWLWPWLQSWLQPSARTLTALAARGGVVPIGSSWTVARERSFLNGAALH